MLSASQHSIAPTLLLFTITYEEFLKFQLQLDHHQDRLLLNNISYSPIYNLVKYSIFLSDWNNAYTYSTMISLYISRFLKVCTKQFAKKLDIIELWVWERALLTIKIANAQVIRGASLSRFSAWIQHWWRPTRMYIESTFSFLNLSSFPSILHFNSKA